jgi:CrcB protein
MSLGIVCGVGLLGGLGAIARFGLDGVVAGRTGRRFPYGTFVVNIVGCLAEGVVIGAAVGPDAYRLLGTGLIGSFTTFSTWVLESNRLGEDGELGLGSLNFLVSLLLGIAAVWVGRYVGASL